MTDFGDLLFPTMRVNPWVGRDARWLASAPRSTTEPEREPLVLEATGAMDEGEDDDDPCNADPEEDDARG